MINDGYDKPPHVIEMQPDVPREKRGAGWWFGVAGGIVGVISSAFAGLTWISTRDQAQIARDVFNFQKRQYTDQRNDALKLAEKQKWKDEEEERKQKIKDQAASSASALAQRDSERSARAAEESATIARESKDNQISILHFTQRARMAHSSTFLESPLAGGVPISLTSTFLNTGPTIATQFRLVNAVVVSLPSEFSTAIHPYDASDMSETSVGPGNPAGGTVHSPDAISQEDVDRIMTGKKILYTFGIVRYCDEFGQGYELDYCLKFEPKATRINNQFFFCPVNAPEKKLTEYCK